MGMHELIRRLREGSHEVYAPASDQDISATELALGMSLPESYKAFVSSFSNGAYLFHLQEVSGVGQGNDQISPIQSNYPIDSNSSPIPFRDGGGNADPACLIPFGLDSNGNAWCFIAERADGEYPVAYLDTSGRKLYGKLHGFSKWLETLIDAQDEVIRVLYGEDVIYDELMLG